MDFKRLTSDAKFYDAYARFRKEDNRYETWAEAVARVMDMHREYYAEYMTPELENLIQFAQDAYTEELVLGSQRALQYAGPELLKNEMRMYNCVSSYVDRPAFFGECFHMLLCGAGAGFSVQKHHIAKLPAIARRGFGGIPEPVIFTVEDTIEGWSDALSALLSSYFVDDQVYPSLFGKRIVFDYSLIRPKGAYISGGFKAPGPEPLMKALNLIEDLLEKELSKETIVPMRPIVAYDIIMHAADSVISGGVRRSACICLFSYDDTEMLNAKTGDWFPKNPQRGRSNNSAMLLRSEVTREQFHEIMKPVQEFGEPGFIFVDSLEHTYNPCVEIGKLPRTESGISGWQGCNLCEINGGKMESFEAFERACIAASILGTLQAGYTNFKYQTEDTISIFEREALLGVSITGWMNNPDVLFSKENMKKGAETVLRINKEVAKMIGINPAARTTCVKPSGNASVKLGVASGIHGEHSPRYIRNVQLTKNSEVAQLLMAHNKEIWEESVWSANKTDVIISFPTVAPEKSIFKRDLLGVKQLEYVKMAQQYWVEFGTDTSLCVDPTIRHNVSNTIVVDDWEAVEDYVFENRAFFAGISFLGMSGDKDYAQAPFTEVLTAEQIVAKYGDAAMFASGLLVDGLSAFNKDLWLACATCLGIGLDLREETHDNLMQRDFERRVEKFAKNYFGGDIVQATYCMKDVYLLHKWNAIQRSQQPIDWLKDLKEKEFTDVGANAAVACSGNKCEIGF